MRALALAVAGIVAAIAVGVFMFVLTGQGPAQTVKPDVEYVIYMGEAGTRYGFGLSKENITSPGPEIMVKRGSVIKIRFENIGIQPHTFVVVSNVKEDPEATPMFRGAQAGTPAKPVNPGQAVEIVFKAETEGAFYYICNVPGHVTLGMWGKFIVK
ncbi:MAG: sulfocyanin-like copper-binding protein [Candidatus Caldarchaeum sp.]